MSGLLSKALLTQRSLFKPIYNILKVIFSLNKHSRDRTVFLACFFKRRNLLFCGSDPRPKTWLPKWWPVGHGSGGGGVGGESESSTAGAGGGWGCQMPKSGDTGRQHPVATSSGISRPLLWEPRICFVLFLACPMSSLHTASSFADEVGSHPNKS